VEGLLFEQAGVVTWAQAVAALGPARVRHLVRSGRWRRVCRGVLLARPGPVGEDQVWWVAVLAAGDGAVLAGLAAARAGGLRGWWRQDSVDVLVPHHRSVAALPNRLPLGLPAVRVRRSRELSAEDVLRGRPARTTMARAVVDAAQWARTDDEALTVVAAACQQRLATAAQIREVLARLPRLRRRRLILQAVGDIEGGASALSEIDFVRLCRRAGVTAPGSAGAAA